MGCGQRGGEVRRHGAKLEPIAVNKNRDVCGDRKPSEALVIGAGGVVKGSVSSSRA